MFLKKGLRVIVWLIAVTIALWTMPDLYKTGCQDWRSILSGNGAIEMICQYDQH